MAQRDELDPDLALARAIADCFWVPEDVRVVDTPDRCWLSCPRDVPMLNAVLRTRVPESQRDSFVAEVRATHGRCASRWLVGPLDDTPGLVPALEAAGYRPGERHYGQTLRVDRALPGGVPGGLQARPVVDLQGMRDWYRVSAAAFDETRHTDDAELRLYLSHCTGPGARVVRVVAYDLATGEPLSSGGMTLFPDLGFGMLWAGGTAPAGRGRGAYRAVLQGRIEAARAAGLSRVGLYARVDTSAPIVARLGFERHGMLDFWERRAAG